MSYYDDNAREYIDKTINCDMRAQYSMLLKYVKKGTLLDVGFGSGRDMLYFKSKGFEVFGIDPTLAFCNHARSLDLNVEQSTIENYNTNKKFDVIWVCASLLHCKDLNSAFKKCYDLLKQNGIMYVSLKVGEGEENIDNRYFHYVSHDSLSSIIYKNNFKVLKECITEDSLSNRNVDWINCILTK